MEPSRRPILFVSYPDSGLLNTMLVLAGELARRGVPDLWFATDESRREQVDALRAESAVEFVSMGEVIPELSAVSWDDETYRRVTQRSKSAAHRALVRHTFVPAKRAEKYRLLAAAAEKIQPTLMVVESLCQYGYELAITKKIPFILNAPLMPSNVLASHVPFARSYTPPGFPVPHSGHPLRMSPPQQAANWLFKARTLGTFLTPSMIALGGEDQRLRKELGIDPAAGGLMSRIDAAELVLCCSVPEMDYPFELPAKVRTVGTLVPPLPQAPQDDGLSGWLDARESVIYVGFGTVTRLTEEQIAGMVEVARRLDGRYDVLWKLPSDQQRLLPPAETLPGNLRIEDWVPSQLDVLAHPHVRAFFTHAGGNGFHEGVYFGKPMLVRPLWVDCYDQAVRGEDFGVSLTVDDPKAIDPEDVVAKLTRVIEDGSFRERAEYLGQLLRQAGGRQAAADIVLEFNSGR